MTLIQKINTRNAVLIFILIKLYTGKNLSGIVILFFNFYLLNQLLKLLKGQNNQEEEAEE